jgi:hypothetical protein
MRNITLRIAALVAAGAVLNGCSGGGGGIDLTAPDANSASAAMTASLAAFGAGSSGTGNAKAGGPATASQVGVATRALALVKTYRGTSTASFRALAPTTTPCFVSGSVTEDPEAGTIVYNDCVEASSGGVETYTNGSLAVTQTGPDSLSIAFTNLRSGTRRASDDRRLQDDTIDGTISASNVVIDQTCGAFITSGSMGMTFTVETYQDANGDATAEVNQAASANNFRMSVTETFNGSCSLTSTRFVANGGFSFVDSIESANDFSASFSNYSVVATPATGGTLVTFSGIISVSSPCVTGTFSIETPTPLFVPDSSGGDDCATAGKVLVSGDDVVVSVTATATGGIEVDEGDDGSIEKSFANCDEADACSA